jgi:hypothetical protein
VLTLRTHHPPPAWMLLLLLLLHLQAVCFDVDSTL